MDDFLTVGDVARLVGISPQAVRTWARLGKLCGQRTASGIRLFQRADVEQACRERAARVGKFSRPIRSRRVRQQEAAKGNG